MIFICIWNSQNYWTNRVHLLFWLLEATRFSKRLEIMLLNAKSLYKLCKDGWTFTDNSKCSGNSWQAWTMKNIVFLYETNQEDERQTIHEDVGIVRLSYRAVQSIFDGFSSMRLCFQSHYSSPFFACLVYFAMKKCTQTKHEFPLIRMSHLVLSCEFLEWPFPDVCWTHTFPMNCVHLTENSFLVHVS